jgi:ferredoxin
MKIRVDPDKCQGHSRCFAIAPDLFDIDDYGQSSLRGDPDGTVPADREDVARLAIANCPEYAITELG